MCVLENNAAVQFLKQRSNVSAGAAAVLNTDLLQVPAGYRCIILQIGLQVNPGSGIGWDAGNVQIFACDPSYSFSSTSGAVPLVNDGAGNLKMDLSKTGVMIAKGTATAGAGNEAQLATGNGYPIILDEGFFLRSGTDTIPGVTGEVYELDILFALIPKC